MRVIAAVTILCVLYGTQRLDAQDSEPLCRDRLTAATHVFGREPVANARLAELLRDSTIAAEMVAYIERAPDVIVSVLANPHLLRLERSGGLSRFFVSGRTLVGRIEFDSGESSDARQRTVLAHELAHAIELTTLRRTDTATLARLLMDRISQHGPWSQQTRIETPFAIAVEKQIVSELKLNRPASAGTLQRLAELHGLTVMPCRGWDLTR